MEQLDIMTQILPREVKPSSDVTMDSDCLDPTQAPVRFLELGVHQYHLAY